MVINKIAIRDKFPDLRGQRGSAQCMPDLESLFVGWN